MPDIKPRIEQAKCPACGWRLDSEAYRCPKCRIYFCYKCRARVGKGENQFQCADQSCACYGKLLCLNCTVMVEQAGLVKSYTIDELHWFALPFVALAIGGISGIAISAGVGIASTILAFALGATLLLGLYSHQHMGVVALHRCCIACRHPVKTL